MLTPALPPPARRLIFADRVGIAAALAARLADGARSARTVALERNGDGASAPLTPHANGASAPLSPHSNGSFAPHALVDDVLCIQVEPGTDFARIADNRYQLDPGHPAGFAQLLEAIGPAPIQDVIYLWPVDATDSSSDVCTGVLHLVQALAHSGVPRPPRLLLVTRGAQAVVPGDAIDGLWQSPLWGLGRVIAREHPELNCRRIDLDPADANVIAAERLCGELLATDAEDQSAHRASQRHVARLVRTRSNSAHAPGGPVSPDHR